MREIKFRLFDGTDCMSSPFTLQDIQDGKVQFSSDCPIMQYTGLKDRNGVEIYEGDVVKWETYYYDLDSPDRMERKPITKIGNIVYLSKGFWIDSEKHPEGFGWEGEDLWDWDKIEVIGNIYEKGGEG